MLQFLPKGLPNADVIVGLDTPDDAGVYRINDQTAIVQTVDFFTPIVDDPYWFGAIAAANSLSDVYAMGGRPITVLQLVGFPITKLPKQVLAEMLRGAADKVAEAGAAILGGHSIDDPEPKFGLACTGIVHPDRIGAKAGARPGDKLILTKPIGIGVITTAIKRGLVPQAEQEEAIRIMAALNNLTDLLEPFDLRGMTDITGFGLLGHASEVARASGVGLRIHASQVPVIPSAWNYARQGTFPGGSKANHRFVTENGYALFDETLDETTRLLLCDAITSGGLLLSVPAAKADALIAALKSRPTPAAAVIGEVVEEHPGQVKVLPA